MELPTPGDRHRLQQFLGVVVTDPERAGRDPCMLTHPGNVLANQVDVGNAFVCLAVGQQEATGDGVCPNGQLPVGKRTATVQPSRMQRGTTPGMNTSE